MNAQTRNQLQLGRLVVDNNSKRIVLDKDKQLAKNMICITANGQVLVKSDYMYN